MANCFYFCRPFNALPQLFKRLLTQSPFRKISGRLDAHIEPDVAQDVAQKMFLKWRKRFFNVTT